MSKWKKSLADLYGSKSQAARVITEDWVEKNMFCAGCGNMFVKHFENSNVKGKIRQQLQFLRDKGYIMFLGDVIYRKI